MPPSPRLSGPGPARSGFNRAPLVRWLASLGGAEVAPSKQTFAERLSPWLEWTDAIALSAALAALADTTPAAGPSAATAPAPAPAELAALAGAVERARSELARAIAGDAAFAAGRPEPEPASSLRSRFQAHQRAMEARLPPLRAALRAALACQSAPLARLAALDAVLEKALAPHERQLLAGVPGLLAAHADGPHLQRALHDELALRLQPLDGLLQALREAAGAAPAAAPGAVPR